MDGEEESSGRDGGQRVQIEWEICLKSFHSLSLLGCGLIAHFPLSVSVMFFFALVLLHMSCSFIYK